MDKAATPRKSRKGKAPTSGGRNTAREQTGTGTEEHPVERGPARVRDPDAPTASAAEEMLMPCNHGTE